MIVQRIFDERLQNKYGVNPETVKAMIDYEVYFQCYIHITCNSTEV